MRVAKKLRNKTPKLKSLLQYNMASQWKKLYRVILICVYFLYLIHNGVDAEILVHSENVLFYRTLNVELVNGASVYWRASRGCQNLTIKHGPEVEIEIAKTPERKLVSLTASILGQNVNAASELQPIATTMSMVIIFCRQPRLTTLAILVTSYYYLTCLVSAQSANSIELTVPSEIIEDICINGDCRPLLCRLGDKSQENGRYSSIPSNNGLLFKQGTRSSCMIRPPRGWQSWRKRYFKNNSTDFDFSFYGDPDADGVINILEFYGTDLFEDAFVSNELKAARVKRQLLSKGTDPTKPDTDGDLLTDAFELLNRLNPLKKDNISSDYDNDGLDNLKEQILGTNPLNPDSDGDGISDGKEFEMGKNPVDPEDKRTKAKSVSVTLTVGDHSGSQSERYTLNVGGISHQSPGFGMVGSGKYTFKSGRYPITISHQGTNIANGTPDYDYTASVTGNPSYVSVSDPRGILGAHMESVYFYAAGKSATLIVAGHEANETDECEKLSSCFGCAGDSKCQWDKKVQFCSRAPYGMISKDLANLECHSNEGNCRFYEEMDAMTNCLGKDNYAIAVGYKNCKTYVDHANEFNSEGQVFLDNVRKCLMARLLPGIRKKASCSVLKETAYSSHAGCYTKNGFCSTIVFKAENMIAFLTTLDWRNVRCQEVWGVVNSCGKKAMIFAFNLIKTQAKIVAGIACFVMPYACKLYDNL